MDSLMAQARDYMRVKQNAEMQQNIVRSSRLMKIH